MNSKDRLWIKMMEFGHILGCHQKPERSFCIKGYQFPVCARCTGVILGQITEIILLIIGIKINIPIALTLLAIMGVDWFIQFIKLLESNNIRRMITGFTGGLALTYIYYRVIILLIEFIKNI